MTDREIFTSSWIPLGEVATRIAASSVEGHPEAWDKPNANNELRRAIGAAVIQHGSGSLVWRVPPMLGLFARLWREGVITPRQPDTYLEPSSEVDIDLHWVVTTVEAEEAIRRLSPPKSAASKLAPAIEQSRGLVAHSTKTRRHTLDPVIEVAQSKCNDPFDTAAVWAALSVLAEQKQTPLLGATEEGIQWLKNGAAAIYSRRNLGDKLRRKKERSNPR